MNGIDAGSWASIENVDVRWHTEAGLLLGQGARVVGGHASENAGSGIHLAAFGHVDGTQVIDNGEYGIDASSGASIIESVVVSGNGRTGAIVVDAVVERSVFADNGAGGVDDNSRSGVTCLGRCVVGHNVVSDSTARTWEWAHDNVRAVVETINRANGPSAEAWPLTKPEPRPGV